MRSQSIDIAEVVGPYAWGVIHHAAETFPCAPCAEEGASLMRFAHDLVNLKVGKQVKYPGDARAWLPTAHKLEATLMSESFPLAQLISQVLEAPTEAIPDVHPGNLTGWPFLDFAEELMGFGYRFRKAAEELTEGSCRTNLVAHGNRFYETAKNIERYILEECIAGSSMASGLGDQAMLLDVSGTDEFIVERWADPSEFHADSFRTVPQGDHRLLLACPKDEWDGDHCRVDQVGIARFHPRSEQDALQKEALEVGVPVMSDREPSEQDLEDLQQVSDLVDRILAEGTFV